MKRENQIKRTRTVQDRSHEPDAERFPSDNSCDTIHSQNGENTMSTTLNFDSLYAAEIAKSTSDYGRYQELLREIAAGKPVPPENEILHICEQVGRDVTMLEEDVKWRQKRDKDTAEARREQEYKTAKREAVEALSKLSDGFQKVSDEYEKACWPHRCKIEEMDRKLHQVFYLRIRLPEDCRDPELHTELERMDSQESNQYLFDNLRKKREQLLVDIEDAQAKLKEKNFSPGRNEKTQQLKANIKDWQAECDRIQNQLDDMRQVDAEREKKRAEIHEAMIFA